MDKVKENILNLLIWASDTMTIRQLNGEYWNVYGEFIPYEMFGFNSFEDYLRSIPESVKVSGTGPLAEVLLASPLKPYECELIVRKRRNRYRRRYQRKGPLRKEEMTPCLMHLLARYEARTFQEQERENKHLNFLAIEVTQKNTDLKLTNELLSSRLEELQAESESRLKLTRDAQSASVDESAGHNNKTVIQQSTSQINNSDMVNSYRLNNNCNETERDSSGDNSTPMKNESEKDQTPEDCVDSGKVAEVDEWDYNMAYYYGKMPNVFVDEETYKNCSSSETVGQEDEWDYNMFHYYGKMPNVFGVEETYKNCLSSETDALEDEWDYNMFHHYGKMPNVFGVEETYKNCLSSETDALEDEWDYNMFHHYGKMPNVFGVEETYKNCLSSETDALEDEWDYNMFHHYGKMPNVFETHENRSSSNTVSQEDKWDYKYYNMVHYYSNMPNVYEEAECENLYGKVSRGAEENGKIHEYKPGKRVRFNV